MTLQTGSSIHQVLFTCTSIWIIVSIQQFIFILLGYDIYLYFEFSLCTFGTFRWSTFEYISFPCFILSILINILLMWYLFCDNICHIIVYAFLISKVTTLQSNTLKKFLFKNQAWRDGFDCCCICGQILSSFANKRHVARQFETYTQS